MQQTWRLAGQLFYQTLVVSSLTLGGGYVIVPLLRERFVEKLGLLSEEDMLDFTAIAQTVPGSVAVNAALLIGDRLLGLPGALLALLGTILPPLLLLSMIASLYEQLLSSGLMAAALRGMQIAVAALLLKTVGDLFILVFRGRPRREQFWMGSLMLGVVSLKILGLSLPLILAAIIVLGALLGWRRLR